MAGACSNELDEDVHTSQSVHMAAAPSIHPTLWRTCRVIANRKRLAMFGLFVQRSSLTVSEVAKRQRTHLSVASAYLRSLEARGLLVARRKGRWVQYSLGKEINQNVTARLVVELRAVFKRDASPVETIYRIATAFAHPRRIEVFRVLQGGPQALGQLRAATHISSWSLMRHLNKLESRGFVTHQDGLYAAVDQLDGLRQEFGRLAKE